MKNIGTLYRYEMKKILSSRLTQITLLLLLGITALMGLMLTKDLEIRDAMRELDGRSVDNALIDEMNRQIPSIYETKWEGEDAKYFGISYTFWTVNDGTEPLSADAFYENRQSTIQEMMHLDGLSENEISWWRDKEANIRKPFIHMAWLSAKNLAEYMGNICLFGLIAAALCLSGSFAGEHRRNTDQILLCCFNGKKETYFSKILAGMSFMIGYTVLYSGLLAAFIYIRTGLEGLSAVVQLEIPFSSYPLTFGQFIMIQFIITLAASILFAVMAMFFSEAFRNGVAVMGVMIGLYLATQIIYIPTKYRLPSQVMNLFPTAIVDLHSLADHRLINIGGHYLTNYQAAPVIYLILAVFLYFAGRHVYCRFQVSGR